MKVLFVSNFFTPHVVGGAEIVAERLCADISRRGHDVAVFAGRQPDKDAPPGYLDIEHSLGFTVYRIAMQSLDPSQSAFWHEGGLAFRSVLQYERPDIVHFHNTVGLGVNLLPAAKEFGCATIVTLHDYWGICHKNTLLLDDGSLCVDHEQCHFCLSHFISNNGVARPTRLRRDYVSRCLEMADKLVSPSKALTDVYEADLTRKKVLTRSNGIELSKFAVRASNKSTSDEKVRFIFSGYLGKHKGVEVLLNAVQRLSHLTEFNGRWQLSILGTGHLQEDVESALFDLPGAAINYLGKVPYSDIPGLLRKHDVTILPSIWPENESVALLEAIAAGMAQIATRIGGNVDLVEDGRSGFLVEPGDASALLDAMITFIKQPSLVDRFSKRNKMRRTGFSSSKATDCYENDYKALLKKKTQTFKETGPLIICGSGWPDLNSTVIVNSFATLFAKSVTPRFVPCEWVSALDWQAATLFWDWTNDSDRALLRKAMDFGIPVLVSSTHELAQLNKVMPSTIYPYENITQATAIIDALCSKFQAGQSNVTLEGDLLATFLKLRDNTDTFSLKAEMEI